MKSPFSVRLPDAIYDGLQQAAGERGIKVSQVTRAILAEGLAARGVKIRIEGGESNVGQKQKASSKSRP